MPANAQFDRSMIATARLVLSWSALLIVFVDPTEPDRFVSETYGVMVLYSLYSLSIFVTVWLGRELPKLVENHSWWIDTFSYLVLISLSSGTHSIFFFFFFFAVAAAAFSRGFRTGMSVTGVSVLGFSILGILLVTDFSSVDLGRYVLRPLSLLVVGYMLSIWGEHQTKSLRRLALLGEIGSVSNPRFGIDRTIDTNIERIRKFFKADECVFLTRDPESGAIEVRHRASPHRTDAPSSLAPESPFSQLLLSLPESLAAVWTERPAIARFFGVPETYAYDCERRKVVEADPEIIRSMAGAVEARSLLTCPIFHRGEAVGRFLVSSGRREMFDRNDIPFLLQAIDQFIPIVENIRLVDQMASDAADLERKRIARNIHDSIIQPYIGLQLGIESLSQYVRESGSEETVGRQQMSERIERLEGVAKEGIDDLRNYVHGLSSSEAGRSSVLLDSLRRFAQTFTSGTGIGVEIDFESGLRLRDRLAAEAFQMIAEALSNVRKHTNSKVAMVRLSSDGSRLLIEILNRRDDNNIEPKFTPRSIAQRTASLGGRVDVITEGQFTTLAIGIPM